MEAGSKFSSQLRLVQGASPLLVATFTTHWEERKGHVRFWRESWPQEQRREVFGGFSARLREMVGFDTPCITFAKAGQTSCT